MMGVRRKRLLGFTILEVMIAVVILAIGLSSLFTSEAGAIRIAQRARTTTIATLLARCKMAEIEERIAKEGWPGDVIDDNDECCTDGAHDGFRCEWKVERIKLPDINEDKEEEDGDSKGSKDGKDKGDSDSKKGSSPAGGGMLDQLAELSKDGPEGRMNAITDMLSGGGAMKSESSFGPDDAGTDEYDEGEMDPLGSMVMGMAFPMMKPVIEEGVRRATVRVNWKEGDKEQHFEVVQFLVSEQQLILPDSDDPDAGAGATGAGGSPTGAPTGAPQNSAAGGAR